MRPLLLLALLLSGCSSLNTRALNSQQQDAVRAAEAFVVRNGYTAAGHPANLPVQRVSIYDAFHSDEELIKSRKGLLETHAIAVEQKTSEAIWVYFPEVGQKDTPRIVLVSNGKAIQLFHQSYGPPSRKAIPVAPPN